MREKRTTSVVPTDTIQPLPNLDGLLGHLSSCNGLYAKSTFVSLYSSLTRMIRDQRLKGFVLTRTLGVDAFETVSYALENLHDITLVRLEDRGERLADVGIPDDMGLLLVLTDRLCAALHWTCATEGTFKLLEGGWTFHPGDAKTLATQLIGVLKDPVLDQLLAETPTDRRFDEKLTMLVTSMVNSLESQNRELTMALQKVQSLNQKVVENERLAAVGQLCSVIAHEIRNPLGLIDLYAKLVEGQLAKIPPESMENAEVVQKNLAQIRQATGDLEGILSELTQYARPLELKKESVNLRQLVEDVCDFYRPSFEEQQVGLQLQITVQGIEQTALWVEADVLKLRQSLLNLLKNALEVSPPDTTVTVTIARRHSDEVFYVKVADQGSGVAADAVPKLFTPYFSTKEKGTGLGLAHVRKIMQAHGGNAQLLSTIPGQGSTFALILPMQMGK